MAVAVKCGASAALVAIALMLTTSQVYTDDSITRGCVIRFYEEGPVIHENSSHVCDLATSVEVLSNGRLRLNGTPDLPVKSISVTSDESLVQRMAVGGPSGGSGDIEIQMAKTDTGSTVWATNDLLACEFCNIWVSATYYLEAL